MPVAPPALMRHQFGKVRQPPRLLAIGPIELCDRRRCVGRGVGEVDQFLIARQLAGKQRIGEGFLQRRDGTFRLALEIGRIDLVGGSSSSRSWTVSGRWLRSISSGVGGRYAEPLGHGGLGQAETVADAADAGTGENLCSATSNRSLQTVTHLVLRGDLHF